VPGKVFAGGAALYFMRPQAAPVEVLNDITGDLVTLYRVVQNHLEEICVPVQMGTQFPPGVRVAEDGTSRNPHRHPASGSVFLLTAPCLCRQGDGADIWHCDNWPAISLLRIGEAW